MGTCVLGNPTFYTPDGELVYCSEPIRIEGFGDVAAEFFYLVERLPVYVVAAGALAGLAILFLCALTVKGLMT